jgi:hypothetical protein
MKKLLITLTLIGTFCIPSIAQDLSQVELYGGYLFQKYPGVYLHGFVGAVEVHINRFFSVVGEYGFGYNGLSYWEGDVSWNDMTFMIGPRFSYRRDRVRFFAHVLWGGMRNSSNADRTYFLLEAGSVTKVAMAFEGGIDIALNERISIRPIQWGGLITRKNIDGNWTGPASGWSDQARYSGGIVFKFGSK